MVGVVADRVGATVTGSFGSRSLPPPTTEELAYQAACRAAGCEACHQLGLPKDKHCSKTFEFHHPKDGGQQIAHWVGYALGQWHHQGKCRPGVKREEMLARYDVNLADNQRGFHARFGSDQALMNGQRDRIGMARAEIPSHRQLRLERGHAVRRKPSQCTKSSKTVDRPEWWRP